MKLLKLASAAVIALMFSLPASAGDTQSADVDSIDSQFISSMHQAINEE